VATVSRPWIRSGGERDPSLNRQERRLPKCKFSNLPLHPGYHATSTTALKRILPWRAVRPPLERQWSTLRNLEVQQEVHLDPRRLSLSCCSPHPGPAPCTLQLHHHPGELTPMEEGRWRAMLSCAIASDLMLLTVML
jgi:hypothetical protein